MKEIVVRIGKGGKINLEAFGFKGSECLSATKGIQDDLGIIENTEKKPEFTQSKQSTESKQTLGGSY